MAREPVWRMIVDEKITLNSDIEGRTFHFCSSVFQMTFLEPEKNLRVREKVLSSPLDSDGTQS